MRKNMKFLGNKKEGGDPSLLKKNLNLVKEWGNRHPRPKSPLFDSLHEELGDGIIAEMIWLYYGGLSYLVINEGDPYFNKGRCRLKFWKNNTIRSLVKTNKGKQRIWKFLHDSANGKI